jgi:thioesterase domain-containing protein
MRFARRNCPVSVDYLRQQGSLEQQLTYAIDHGVLPPGLDVQTGIRYARAGMSNTRAKNLYVPKHYPGRVTLFRANRGHILTSSETTLGWGRIALGGIEIRDIAGEHNAIVEQPYVQTLARELRVCLDRAQGATPNSEAVEEVQD